MSTAIEEYVGTWVCDSVNPGPFRGPGWYPATGTGSMTIVQQDDETLVIDSVTDFGLTGNAAVGVKLGCSGGVAHSAKFSIAGQGGAGPNEELQLVVNKLNDSMHVVHFWVDNNIIIDSGIWTMPTQP